MDHAAAAHPARTPRPARVCMQDAGHRCSSRRITRRPSCSSAAWTAARARPTRAAHPRPRAPPATAPPCGPVAASQLVISAVSAGSRHQCCTPERASLFCRTCWSSSLPLCKHICCLHAPCGTAPLHLIISCTAVVHISQVSRNCTTCHDHKQKTSLSRGVSHPAATDALTSAKVGVGTNNTLPEPCAP